MNIILANGDIRNISADAVVLPANCELRQGSGVSDILFKTAGEKELAAACEKLKPCNIGSATVTESFRMSDQYKCIVHAIVPKWIDGKSDEYTLLCSAYESALEVADYMKLQSIVFPLLASGNNGFDLELAFEIACKTIEHFESQHLKQVILVLHGKKVNDIAMDNGYALFYMDGYKKTRHYAGSSLNKKEANIFGKKAVFVAGLALDVIVAGAKYLNVKDNKQRIAKHAIEIVVPILKKAI